MTVRFAWHGAVTTSSFVVATEATASETLTFEVSLNSGFTSFVYSTTQAATLNVPLKFTVLSLSAKTVYYWRVRSGTTSTVSGRCKTFPVGAANLVIGVSACGRGIDGTNVSNHPVYAHLANRGLDLFLHLGDLHYRDRCAATDFRDVNAQSNQSALYRNVPWAYTWDDHDYGGDNSSGTSSFRGLFLTRYKEYVPHYPLLPGAVDEAPIMQDFVIGRLRIVMLDGRSARFLANGTLLGPQQLARLYTILDEVKTNGKQGLIINTGVPWISSSGTDTWFGYPAERTAIANAIASRGLTRRVIFVAADAHCVAIDSGVNNKYGTGWSPGPPVMQAAALDSAASTKGGPYSEGSFAGPSRYGILEVIDAGTDVLKVTMKAIVLNGSTEELRTQYVYDMDVGAVPPGEEPDEPPVDPEDPPVDPEDPPDEPPDEPPPENPTVMSEIVLAPETWADLLTHDTAQARAVALAGKFASGGSVEFRTSTDTIIRTVSFGAWSVGQRSGDNYPVIAGEYTDTAEGSGSPAVAVFKADGIEVLRCSCGVDSGFYRLFAAIAAGVPIRRGDFAINVLPPPVPEGQEPPDTIDDLVVSAPASIDLTQGESYDLVQHVSGGVTPYSFALTGGTLPAGITVSAAGSIDATESATVGLSGIVTIEVTDAQQTEPPEDGFEPENTTLPEIIGNAAVGEVLTSTDGEWLGAPTSFARQWYRDGTFTGQTGVTYTVVAADEGQLLTVVVTATNDSGSVAATSEPTGPVVGIPVGAPPDNVTLPVITGLVQVGGVLTSTTGTWTNSPTRYERLWYRDDTAITGATGVSYTIGAVDEGMRMSVVVTAINTAGEDRATSAKTAAVIVVAANAAPVNQNSPEIFGRREVGYTLTVEPGSWVNRPAGYTYQWRRAGVAITGATGTTYRLVEADLGKAMTVTETAVNAAGSASKTSGNTVTVKANSQTARPTVYSSPGPIIHGRARVGEPLSAQVGMWNNVPDRHEFQWLRGSAAINGATLPYYWIQQADLGAKIYCRVTGINPIGSTAVTTPATATVVARRTVPSVVLPKFGLVSEVGGSNLPFSFAHGFAKGHIPAGKVPLLSGLSTFQAVPINTYPDGSVRLAWISGRATLTANVKSEWQVTAGSPAVGTPPSLTTLRGALTSGTIDLEGFEAIDIPDLIAGAPADIFGNGNNYIFQGPQCSYWVWRMRVRNNAHLEVFVPIRLYAGGAIQIDLPWLQNGDLIVPGPMHYPAMAIKVTLNGTTRYSQTAGIQSHRVLPLVIGKSVDHSYWYGTNPKIRPVHDTIYLSETAKLTPRYRDLPPSAATLNARPQSYTPNWPGDVANNGQASAPGFEPIGPVPMSTARWVTSKADSRAYDSMIVNGVAWTAVREMHMRDGGGYGANTGRYIRLVDYPRIVFQSSGSMPYIPRTTEGWPNFDQAHQGATTYGPWITTGSLYFLEEMQAQATQNYIHYSYLNRRRGKGIFGENIQTRGIAWSLRTLGHVCASLPDSHDLRGDFLTQLENNAEYTAGKWVDGSWWNYLNNGWTSDPMGAGAESNQMGVMYDRDGHGYALAADLGPYYTRKYGSPWQSVFCGLAWKLIKDLDVSVSDKTKAQIDASMRFAMMLSVQMAGGMGGDWPYTAFNAYAFPMAEPNGGIPKRWLPSMAEAYSSWCAGWGITPNTSPPAGQSITARPGYGTSTDGWATHSAYAPSLGLLVCAVEEGVPTAPESLARVEGSATFSTSTMDDYPGWAMKARSNS